MLLLRFEGGEAKMMSIPRDLYVPDRGDRTGRARSTRPTTAGPRRLILTIQESLGIPIHHYMEVDFVSFAKLVDSLGGITIDFPNPAFDRELGPRHHARPARTTSTDRRRSPSCARGTTSR